MKSLKMNGIGNQPPQVFHKDEYVFAHKDLKGRLNKNGRPWTARTICQYNVEQVLYKRNKFHSHKHKLVSESTRSRRWIEIKSAFNDLHDLGYRIVYPHSIDKRHIVALTRFWEASGLKSSSVIQKYSTLSIFLRWIDKYHLIEILRKDDLYEQPNKFIRKTATQEDKSWKGANIAAIISKIENADKHIANQLRLSMLFGMRAKESMLFRPCLDYNLREKIIYIRRGTKNGRPRILAVESEEQREFLSTLIESRLDKNSSMVPRMIELKQWIKYYYRVLNKHGISRKNGLTPHGLRHGYAHKVYEQESGQPAPILMQKYAPSMKLNPIADKIARLLVSQKLGHSRLSIASAYIGK